MWWITLVLHLGISRGISYAQLTSPDEPVCVRKQVVFSCRQAGFSGWTVNLPSGEELTSPLISSALSVTELMLNNDPGFGFTVHILSTSPSLLSELHVTAVSELNGATVICTGGTQTMPSTIQISSDDPPSAPHGVQATVNKSQFTPSAASITLTWSTSSEADNYTIMVMPPLPSGENLLSTTATSIHLELLYNEMYSINITIHSCGGSNSTIVNPSPVVGCVTPSDFSHGIISKHKSGAVGAMLTFQCDPGYMPQSRTSVCMPNTSWVPPPECNELSCGAPDFVDGIVVETFNDTRLYAMISVRCVESDILMMLTCGSNGEWFPHPASFQCINVSQCGPPTAPVNGHINAIYSSTVEGSQITFHCGGDSPVMISTCTNGSWIPDPADLDCHSGEPTQQGPGNTVSAANQVIITAVVCSLVFFVLGMLVGALLLYWTITKCVCTSKQSSSNSPSPPVMYETVSPHSHFQMKNDIELKENVAYGPIERVHPDT